MENMKDKTMDLHIHSNISLGCTLGVEDILMKAQKEKTDVIAITDNNSALASVVLQHIDISKYYKGTVIPGAEIDAVAEGITFELLAYNFNIQPVQNWLYYKYATVEIRQARIREKLLALAEKKKFKLDKDFPWNYKKEYGHVNVWNNIKRYPENLKLLGNPKITEDRDFYRYVTMDKTFPLYINMVDLWTDIKEVVNVIHNNGGIVILAHPFGYRKETDVDKLLNIVKKNKVDGLEVYNPKHTKEQQQHLLDFAKKHNMLVGGGSDFKSKEGAPILPFAKLKNLL